MSSPEDRIDSLEKFRIWHATKASSFIADPYIAPKTLMPDYGVLSMPAHFPLPSDTPVGANILNSIYPNEHNFWLSREALRFCIGEYRLLPCIKKLQDRLYDLRSRYWWHMPHASKSEPGMVAYTPSYQYGIRDRQVRVKLGKYLQQFYGDVLTPEEIRDFANLGRDQEILWAYGSDAIEEIYVDGPDSCMSGDADEFNGPCHPARVYGYQRPDGSYDFGLAYLKNKNDDITARGLVALKDKVFVRLYGDDANILQSKLEDAGYTLVGSMQGRGLRLRHIEADRNTVVMPYLDGDGKYFDGPRVDEKGVEYWSWDGNGSYHADSSNGVYRLKEQMQCGHCGDDCDEEDMSWSSWHETHVCESCCDRHYRFAYYGRHGDQTYVHEDDFVFCESNDEYYRNHSSVLDYHEVVQVTVGSQEGNYYKAYDTVTLHDGEVACEDDSLVVCNDDDEHDLVDNMSNEWRYSLETDRFYHPDYIPDDGTSELVQPGRLPFDFLKNKIGDSCVARALIAALGADELRFGMPVSAPSSSIPSTPIPENSYVQAV